MASYQGGKQKIGKHIHSMLIRVEEALGKNNLDYFEPFVGFCGVLKHFDSSRERYACDKNKDIIALWIAILNGWIPENHCTLKRYRELQNMESSNERTFYGHVCSFGGLFFGGYLSSRNYAAMGVRSFLKIKEQIKGTHFIESKSYEKHTPKNMLVYCDPPYKENILHNKYFKEFNHEEFWKVMRKWSKNNIVVISERQAPADFVCIWKCQRPTMCSRIMNQRHDECLFIHSKTFNKCKNLDFY
jgi:DNA adenine methylase